MGLRDQLPRYLKVIARHLQGLLAMLGAVDASATHLNQRQAVYAEERHGYTRQCLHDSLCAARVLAKSGADSGATDQGNDPAKDDHRPAAKSQKAKQSARSFV